MSDVKKIFRGRAPLRLGLAGGGTDVSPYSDTYGGNVLNVTIDRYAFASVEVLSGSDVEFFSVDLNVSEHIEAVSPLDLGGKLVLHRAAYNVIVEQFLGGRPVALRMTTFVDSPMGSGLGSSSALVVAMVEALREAFQLPLGEYDVARLAFHIEREVAGLAGGRQDQYAATFGGFNFMEFGANNQVIVNPLRIPRRVWNELESSLVLCFTGVSRASAKIIDDQSKSVAMSGSKSLEAMHQLRADAREMKDALLVGNVKGMASILNRSWEAKKQTSDAITSSSLDEMYLHALEHGATAGKISGAGGGGFMFFLVEPERRARVMAALADLGGVVSGGHFVAEGSECWTSTDGRL